MESSCSVVKKLSIYEWSTFSEFNHFGSMRKSTIFGPGSGVRGPGGRAGTSEPGPNMVTFRMVPNFWVFRKKGPCRKEQDWDYQTLEHAHKETYCIFCDLGYNHLILLHLSKCAQIIYNTSSKHMSWRKFNELCWVLHSEDLFSSEAEGQMADWKAEGPRDANEAKQ